MRKSLLILLIFAVFSAVSFAQDGLIGYEAPSSVFPGSTVTINVNYTSAVDCDLIVYFRDGTPYNTFETQRFPLTAGTDVTTSVDIDIKADAPIGDTYEYAIFLTATGGEWSTRIGNGINTPASVVDGLTGLIGYEAPSSVFPGSTVTINVNYTSAADCDLIVYFRKDGTPYNTFETQRFPLTAGADVTTSVAIDIKADAPLGDNYEYAIFLTATGGEWGTRIGNGINTPASVVRGDGLIGYEAPASVVPGSTVTIDVNYTSVVDCDLIIYFRTGGTPYNTPETQRFALTAGTDVTTSVAIDIKADAPLGDNYEYAIFLTATGGEWNERIGDGINTPASVVRADGLIGYEAPASVAPGSTVTIDVNYTSAVDCDLIVYFRTGGTPYNTPETQRFALTAGTDVTTSVAIDIKTDAPLGDNYEYAIFLTATGGEWNERIGDGINTPASVVRADGLIGYEAPASVTPGSTVTINVNYTSAVDCDLIVYFRTGGTPYNTPETQRFALTAGTDVTTSVAIDIKADAPLGDNYEYAIFLTAAGGEWNERIGDGINTPASVVDATSSAADITNQFGRISYPTASSQLIYFKSEVKTVQVVNLSGQVVLSKAGSAFRSIDISSLQNSVYIIVIDNNKCEKIMKI